MPLTARERLIVALDYKSLAEARPLVEKLRGKVTFKYGLQLVTAEGLPAVVREVGWDNFCDLKFDDIPNTVAGAVEAAAMHRVKMLSIHCSAGEEAMIAAKQAAYSAASQLGHHPTQRTLVLGVTVLTSQDDNDLRKMGYGPRVSVPKVVAQLAKLAYNRGLDGVVCSPQEISVVRDVAPDSHFLVVTPGIRKSTDEPDDQKRTLTAAEAFKLGATHVVVGRPITKSPDPVAAAEEFLREINLVAAAV